MKRESYADKVFIVFNSIFLCALVFIVLYPLVYVVSASISNPVLVNTGQMWLWPKEITFEGYKRVFENSDIWMGYKNTIIYTLLGVAIHLFILLPCAYAVSRRGLMGKKAIMWYFLFTMFFNGGLIPTYLLVKDLGMVNTLWAMVLPNALGVWSIIVASYLMPLEFGPSLSLEPFSNKMFRMNWSRLLKLMEQMIFISFLKL